MAAKTSALCALLSVFVVSSAGAVEMTLTGENPNGPGMTSVTFDTDDAPIDARWVQGGVFSGNPDDRRAPCDTAGVINTDGSRCNAPEVIGYDPSTEVELTLTNVGQAPQDVISAIFDRNLVNGAGVDLLVFEGLDSSDSPALRLTIAGMDLLGTALSIVEIDGDDFTIWGFDFSDAPLSLMMGAVIGQEILITTAQGDGSADIAAIVGINFEDPFVPPADVPLPAALPLFLMGLGGIAFARRGERSKSA